MTLNHIGIIPDGNGRWATQNGLLKSDGHNAGAIAAKNLIKIASRHGVKHLTFYGFSSENWNRTDKEVKDLMSIISNYLKNEINDIVTSNVRFRVIGDKSKLSPEVQEAIDYAENATRNNHKFNLYLALSYGGRDEITRCIRKIVDGQISSDQINEDLISTMLDVPDMPNVDLVIRTSGEMRLSNFLIWQTAYSELYFSKKLWPDFGEDDLIEAINEYKNRERNFGYAREQIRQ